VNPTVPIALFGWPVVVIALFTLVRPRVAVATSFLGAWLFLPMAGYEFQGWPGYSKVEAAAYGALLGVFLFDFARLSRLRVSLLDVPVIVWCLTPMASSLTNGLGAYDGASAVFSQVMAWGVPYLMGRLYFADLEGLRTLAIAIVVGGLLYVPLCLFEVRMSPRLHIWVYGFHQHSWRQAYAFGGWRPTVFMQHGLAVGMWMTTASITALWLWWSGALRRIGSFAMGYIVPALIVTTVLCKSAGAIGLLAIGAAAFAITRQVRTAAAVWCLALLPVVYMGARGSGVWDGSHLLTAVESVVPSKEGSLRYRMEAEDVLAEHARRQLVFGWGGHSRNRPAEMGYEDAETVATDGFWIITLGQHGLVGLTAVASIILLPVVVFLWRVPAPTWRQPAVAPVAALAVVLILFMADSLFNAMMNPVYVLAAGGLSGALARRVTATVPDHRSAQPVELNQAPGYAVLTR